MKTIKIFPQQGGGVAPNTPNCILVVDFWQNGTPTATSSGQYWFSPTDGVLHKSRYNDGTFVWDTFELSEKVLYVYLPAHTSYMWNGGQMVVVGTDSAPTIDAELSSTSPNPLRNSVIYALISQINATLTQHGDAITELQNAEYPLEMVFVNYWGDTPPTPSGANLLWYEPTARKLWKSYIDGQGQQIVYSWSEETPRSDRLYISIPQKLAYYWGTTFIDGVGVQAMIPLGTDLTITAGNNTININDYVLNMAHSHSFADIKNKGNYVSSVIAGNGKLYHVYANGDIAITDFQPLVTRVADLENWKNGEHGVDAAISDLQGDVADLKKEKENTFIRFSAIVDDVTIEQTSYVYQTGSQDTFDVVMNSSMNNIMLKVVPDGNLLNIKYYIGWSGVPTVLDREKIDPQGDFFYMTDGTTLTVYHWHGSESEGSFKPTGNSITVDSALSDSSENPVQNKVIKAALDAIDTALSGKASSADLTALATRVTALEGIESVVTIKYWGNALSPSVTPSEGDYWFDTTLLGGGLKRFNGSQWVSVTLGYKTAYLCGLTDHTGVYIYNGSGLQRVADETDLTSIETAISGLQTAMSGKADASTVTALSGRVEDIEEALAENAGAVILPKVWGDNYQTYQDWQEGDYWYDTSQSKLKRYVGQQEFENVATPCVLYRLGHLYSYTVDDAATKHATEGDVDVLEQDLNDEITARGTADTNLQTQIDQLFSDISIDVGEGYIDIGDVHIILSHNHSWQSIANAPDFLTGVQVGQGTLAFTHRNGDQTEVAGLFNVIQASVVTDGPTPWVDAICENGVLRLIFHNIKGEQGEQGDTVILGQGETYTLYNGVGNNTDGAMTQYAVTQLVSYLQEILGTEVTYSLIEYTQQNCSLGGYYAAGGYSRWYMSSLNDQRHIAIPVNPGDRFILTNTGTAATFQSWAWMTSAYNPPYVNKDAMPLSSVQTTRYEIPRGDGTGNNIADITAPADAAYLVLNMVDGTDGGGLPSSWTLTRVTSSDSIKGRILALEDFVGEIPDKYLYGTTGQNTDGAMTQKAVTDELYKINQSLGVYSSIDISSLTVQNCSVGASYWYMRSSTLEQRHVAVPVRSGDVLTILPTCDEEIVENAWVALLSSSYNPPYVNGNAIPFASGETERRGLPMGEIAEITIPDGCVWVALTTVDGAGYRVNYDVQKYSPTGSLAQRVDALEEALGGDPTLTEYDNENLPTSLYSYWSNSKGTATRGVLELEEVLTQYDNYVASVAVASNSPIKAGIQPRLVRGDYQSVGYDQGWFVAGQTCRVTKSNCPQAVSIAFVFTYTAENTGIPPIAEVMQYCTFSVTFTKNGRGGFQAQIDNITDAIGTTSPRDTTTAWGTYSGSAAVYTGEKIDLSTHTYSISLMGTMSRPSSYSVGGTTRYAYTQGGAAYGRYLFQLHTDNKYLRVYDMETNTVVQSLTNTTEDGNHCNAATFGTQKYASGDNFPLLYVSDMEIGAVNVYRFAGAVGSLTMTKVQTITLDTDIKGFSIGVDTDNNKFIVYGYTFNIWEEPVVDGLPNHIIFGIADIPLLSEGNCTKVVRNQFKTPYIFALQGSFVRNGKLYISWGGTDEGWPGKGRGILVVDMAKRDVVSSLLLSASIPLTDNSTGQITSTPLGDLESETAVWYDGDMWITTQYSGPTGQKTAKVYKLTF